MTIWMFVFDGYTVRSHNLRRRCIRWLRRRWWIHHHPWRWSCHSHRNRSLPVPLQGDDYLLFYISCCCSSLLLSVRLWMSVMLDEKNEVMVNVSGWEFYERRSSLVVCCRTIQIEVKGTAGSWRCQWGLSSLHSNVHRIKVHYAVFGNRRSSGQRRAIYS